jgi:hypothetical protein
MHRIARHLTAYAWIAALAILFNALAPVVSHARAQAGVTQVEVCTAMGVVMVSMPGDKPDPDHLLKGMSHCAYCATHGVSFGLPPHAMPLVAVLGGHDVFPPLFYQSHSRLFTWSRAPARAPPAVA